MTTLVGARSFGNDAQIRDVHEVASIVGHKREFVAQRRSGDPEVVVLSRPAPAVAYRGDPRPDLAGGGIQKEHEIEGECGAPVRNRSRGITRSKARVEELCLAGKAERRNVPFDVRSIVRGEGMARREKDRDVCVEKNVIRPGHPLPGRGPTASSQPKVREDLLGTPVVGQAPDQDAQVLYGFRLRERVFPRRCAPTAERGPFGRTVRAVLSWHDDILARWGLGARVSIPRLMTRDQERDRRRAGIGVTCPA